MTVDKDFFLPPDERRFDQESYSHHCDVIAAWLEGWRAARHGALPEAGSFNWLELARQCRYFMREKHRMQVVCTIQEILAVFDQHQSHMKRDRLQKHIMDEGPNYDKTASW